MIAIVHYGLGNVGAIANIYKKLGIAAALATSVFPPRTGSNP